MKLDRVIAVRNDKTVFRDGELKIKVFSEDYSKADVLNEALNQARIEETGLNIPKIREVTTVDGKWVIVSDYIKGKTLAQLMEEDAENKDKYMQLLVELQLEVQSKNCILLNNLKDRLNKKICQTELEATVRFGLHARLEDMPKHSKIYHGDFRPSNIVITEDGTPFIIDWSHTAQGNGSADAARTYLYFGLYGDEESAEKYLSLYCEKSGTAVSYVRKWIPIIAAALLSEGNEREREYYLSVVKGSLTEGE